MTGIRLFLHLFLVCFFLVATGVQAQSKTDSDVKAKRHYGTERKPEPELSCPENVPLARYFLTLDRDIAEASLSSKHSVLDLNRRENFQETRDQLIGLILPRGQVYITDGRPRLNESTIDLVFYVCGRLPKEIADQRGVVDMYTSLDDTYVVPVPREIIEASNYPIEIPDGWQKNDGYTAAKVLFDAGEETVSVTFVYNSNDSSGQPQAGKVWVELIFPLEQNAKKGGLGWGWNADRTLFWWTQDLTLDQLEQVYASEYVINILLGPDR